MNPRFCHCRVHSGRREQQRGVALVVALLLLVVVTIVGLAAVRSTTMQQKMTSGFLDRQVAFQAAEAALRQGEVAVQAAVSNASFYNCSFDSGNNCLINPFEDTNVPSSKVVDVSTSAFDAGALSASQPQYVIEYLGKGFADSPVKDLSGKSSATSCDGEYPLPASCPDFFRITARSGPANAGDRATVTLQSIYRK